MSIVHYSNNKGKNIITKPPYLQWLNHNSKKYQWVFFNVMHAVKAELTLDMDFNYNN